MHGTATYPEVKRPRSLKLVIPVSQNCVAMMTPSYLRLNKRQHAERPVSNGGLSCPMESLLYRSGHIGQLLDC
jgi:hypothetical protein